MLKAVLSNPVHPEYGGVTIPFPISREEYDHTMELLEGIDIGDVLRQDCYVVELDSRYPILKRLEGSAVNVDELDYLAKRLDSFCEGEDDQFLAMAHKLELADIKDLINLTFCCQQVTVITNFSDLERIGRTHRLNLSGGAMPTEEYAKLNESFRDLFRQLVHYNPQRNILNFQSRPFDHTLYLPVRHGQAEIPRRAAS